MTGRITPLLLLLVLAAACGGGGSADPSEPCPFEVSPAERVLYSSVVFVGVVTATEGTETAVDVTEIWRGPTIDPTTTVSQAPDEPVRRFVVGTRYLFQPATNRPPFVEHSCTPTARYTDAFDSLRPSTATTVLHPAEVPWTAIVVGAGSVASLLVAAGVVAAVRRKRRPVPVWNPEHRIADELDDHPLG